MRLKTLSKKATPSDIAYWHVPLEKLYSHLQTRPEGLTMEEACSRLKNVGFNSLKPPTRGKGFVLFLSQFISPLILLLIFAAILSFFLGGHTDSTIICSIVLLSGLLGYFQERGAINALEKLLQMVENKTRVLRNGKEEEIATERIVPGDVVLLKAGDLVPADGRLVDAKHLFVDEASLTGESFPVEKTVEELPEDTEVMKRTNSLYLGTLVKSGFGTLLVMQTGLSTEYAKISERVRFRPPETAFELGVRKFSLFLLQVTLVLTISIFIFNVFFHRPIIDSLLFALALAVGLTPQLLPAIIAVNLSHGARRMAKQQVIVKRLASIENFGQMDILCSDKTGTVTQGNIALASARSANDQESEKVALFGFLNAHFQAGYANPLDEAMVKGKSFDAGAWNKIDEFPYDFERKRLSVILENEGKHTLISKGAAFPILSVCNRVEWSDGSVADIGETKEQLEKAFERESAKGFRTLALAYGEEEKEENLIFLGFLYFSDPIKPDIEKTVKALKEKGIQLKIITGDHWAVAAHVASAIGIQEGELAIGKDLVNLNDEALQKVASEKNIFAEIDPKLKERLILALRKSHVVGYLGDGINDIPALHSADVGISVENGAPATKEAADIVILKKDLSVLRAGIEEGRRTFVNTMKYVFMATSANFGNMFSMAGASLFLSFLPLLPKQILLTNFFSDLPEMALASDRVDSELVNRVVKWDHRLIRRFMMVFGLLNSLADYLTFGVLLFFLHADEVLFRSAWFVENVITAAFIVLAIRTRRFFLRSKPSRLLVCAVFAVIAIVVALPYLSLGESLFAFSPIPLAFYLPLFIILVIYVVAVEIAKHFFFRRGKNSF